MKDSENSIDLVSRPVWFFEDPYPESGSMNEVFQKELERFLSEELI
jgi:hypothetical protein